MQKTCEGFPYGELGQHPRCAFECFWMHALSIDMLLGSQLMQPFGVGEVMSASQIEQHTRLT